MLDRDCTMGRLAPNNLLCLGKLAIRHSSLRQMFPKHDKKRNKDTRLLSEGSSALGQPLDGAEDHR